MDVIDVRLGLEWSLFIIAVARVMKLRGQVIRVGKREYVVKDQLGEGGFAVIFQTNNPEVICKAQHLASPQICAAYAKEKEILQALSHPNIVKLQDATEFILKDQRYGLLFLQNCSCGTAFQMLEKSEGTPLPQKSVLRVMLAAAAGVAHMHGKGIAHRDVKMENMLLTAKGEFKLCDFGSCSRQTIQKVDASNRVEVEEYIEKTTTPLYRAPEQLDLYSGFEIGLKVDVFALGVLGFILCFQKPPFESRLSAINRQYFIPESHPYSPQLIDCLQRCFTTDPSQRPSAIKILEELKEVAKLRRLQIEVDVERQWGQTLGELGRINETVLVRGGAVAEAGILDKIKRIYSQMTTQTEGWIAGFVEDNEQAPILKYNRSIISKCYEKRYKIEKVYEIIWTYSEEYRTRCLVTLKLLVLLHNLLRKGPPEAVTFEGQHAPIRLCCKLYRTWKSQLKANDSEDIRRNGFVCLLVRGYSLLLAHKLRLCYENSQLMEGNYSLVPYLTNMKEATLLRLTFITSLIRFLDHCLDFHQQLLRLSYLPDIQKAIVLSLIDEEYCLISTITFVLAAFKRAAGHSAESIDLASVRQRVAQVQGEFQRVYNRLIDAVETTQRQNGLFQNSQIILSPEVIKYIRSIRIEPRSGPFPITQYLNYKLTICGLKIPLTYEQVVRNPNFLKDLQKAQTPQNVIQLQQFKRKDQPQSKKKQEKTQLKKHQQTRVQKKSQIKKEVKVEKPQSTELSSKAFSKPKDNKDKIFENFSFEASSKAPKVQESKRNAMMEFTHQNLNKDFLSIDPPQDKQDQFKDFFSIVEVKFQKEKQRKQESPPPVSVTSNPMSNASKEVFCSENKAEINKIQLMNFFFDDEEGEQVASQPQIANSPPVVVSNSPNKSNLIEIEEENVSKSQPASNKPSQKPDLIAFQEESAPVVAKEKITRSPPKENNLIDLREFVVQEVRRNAQQYLIDFGALVFKEKIGYGNSSEVFRGEWRGREVAIKKIKGNLGSKQAEKEFRRQIMTSVRIRHHPQLVTLIGVSQHDNYFYIINEYCNGATLFDLLHQSGLRLPWPSRLALARQIAQGMLFLHTNDPPIIHRDLKSLNVLLFHRYDPGNPDLIQLKIADFGLSRDYASTYMTGTLGTYHWMAPEIFNNEPYTLKADVYSYGIVLWQIASRVPPYSQMKNPHSLMKFITMENGRPDLALVDRDCPMQLRMLMIRCWDKFPSNRPNFSQILTCLDYLSQ